MAELSFEVRKPTPIIALVKMDGAIDNQTVVEFQEKFEQLQHDSFKYFILDMAGIKYVNSSGLGTLVTIADSLGEQQGGIVLTQLQPKVKVVFDMLHLNSFFKVFSNEQEAMKYIETLEIKKRGSYGGKTGRYPVSHERSSEMSAFKESQAEITASRSMTGKMSSSGRIPSETSKISSSSTKAREGMKVEDLNEVKEILSLFFRRSNLDHEEIQQVQDVLMEIGRLIMGRLQSNQNLFYDADISHDNFEINLKLTGRGRK